jgi:hypothetical protein
LGFKTRAALEKAGHTQAILRIKSSGLDLGEIRWGKNNLGRDTETYQAMQEVCRTTILDGFLCHDEMFVWADDLIKSVPDACDVVRHRFPMLFIDEVQDNSEMQSSLLARLFCEGQTSVIRQRYGDSNQAIYRYAGDSDVATTDAFPKKDVRRDIPNSHRFGQELADLAKPFGLVPQELIGAGPPDCTIKSSTINKNAIFLFDDQTVTDVLPSYSEYLTSVFTAAELRCGIFTAVGAVHRATGDDHCPRHMGHYWPDYDPELVSTEPRPRTFCQYLMAGMKRAEQQEAAHPLVEMIAEGLIALARLSNPLIDVGSRRRKHRYIVEKLSSKAVVQDAYLDLMVTLAGNRHIPLPDDWRNKWVNVAKAVAAEIAGGALDAHLSKAFLEWETASPTELREKDNRFKHPKNKPNVELRVGSIHSIKGETHTATLICDTYYRAHHVRSLKGWLLGQKAGGRTENETNQSRLKQFYVAMTRPTHLLCVAMRADALTAEEIQSLKMLNWQVGIVQDSSMQWI